MPDLPFISLLTCTCLTGHQEAHIWPDPHNLCCGTEQILVPLPRREPSHKAYDDILLCVAEPGANAIPVSTGGGKLFGVNRIVKRDDPPGKHGGRLEDVPVYHLRDRKHTGDPRVGVPVKGITLPHVRTDTLAQKYFRRNARQIRRRDHHREVPGVLAVDDAEF